MQHGWLCPVCGAGVAPGRSTCDHPAQVEPLPESFPDADTRQGAEALYPDLDIAREAAKFRQHYAASRSARWTHVWQRWLEGERSWLQARAAGTRSLAGPLPGIRPGLRIPRIAVWQNTPHGTRFPSSMEFVDYEAARAAGTAPELVEESDYLRLKAYVTAATRQA